MTAPLLMYLGIVIYSFMRNIKSIIYGYADTLNSVINHIIKLSKRADSYAQGIRDHGNYSPIECIISEYW